MNRIDVLEGIKSEYLSNENLKALVFLENVVVGSTLPLEYWIEEEYGSHSDSILSAIKEMKEKNSKNLTPEQLLILLEADLSNSNIGGWNEKKVEYEGCIVDAWDVQHEKTIFKIKRRIKKIARTVKDREFKKNKALNLFYENIESITGYSKERWNSCTYKSVTFITDPFNEDLIITSNNSVYVKFKKWNGNRDVSSGGEILYEHTRKVVDDFVFVQNKNNKSMVFIIEKEKIHCLDREDGTNFIFLEEDVQNDYSEEFMDWYDDVYGDSLFASQEKIASAFKEFNELFKKQ